MAMSCLARSVLGCPTRRARFSSSSVDSGMSYSSAFFLCFGGLRRLFWITLVGGGAPTVARARRRASLAALNFLSLLRGIGDGGSGWESNPPPPSQEKGHWI
ncbi:MAG: hypothetical protein HY648_00755 [Acidobacteria bacterium]|nr:hypothetical protein [Acidobacteriota bacterium]